MGTTALPERNLTDDELKLAANTLRRDVIDMLEKSKSGHPGGSLSAADIVATLFFSGVMKYNHNNPEDHTEDRFFLSKGHVAPVLYAAYHLLDWLHDEDMVTLRQLGSRLQGHPDCHACPGIEVCSGSLGQGLSVAAGCALGLSMDALASGERTKKVFVLLGDGELQEGSNWEACMFAAHQKLDNLIAIVDLNNLQIDGHVTDVCSLGDIDEKFRSFGWNVLRVNGHEVTEVRQALLAARDGREAGNTAPTVIICQTVKGKGVSFMEDQASWHGNAPSAEQADLAREELDAARELLLINLQGEVRRLPMSRATREAYGQTLVELVNEGHDIVAVDADLAGSTKLADLQKAFPQRMVDVGIAEQNMVGVASGLALTGRTVFTGSFAVFATGRAYDQIRNTVCDSGLNVKICPTHAGITVGEDGATHQSLEDIGMMRALPQMRVLVPADYNATKAALRLAAEADGPFYVRMGRHKVADIYDESFKGGLPFANVLREGTDVTIAACGVEVAQALAAADLLAEEKISAEVIDVFSIKPLDEEVILASAEKTRHVVTVEEHNVATGLGAAVAELLAEQLPTLMRFAGMRTFGTSAPGDVLLSHFGLDAEGIAARVREFLLS